MPPYFLKNLSNYVGKFKNKWLLYICCQGARATARDCSLKVSFDKFKVSVHVSGYQGSFRPLRDILRVRAGASAGAGAGSTSRRLADIAQSRIRMSNRHVHRLQIMSWSGPWGYVG